jgi:hypothetical protein
VRTGAPLEGSSFILLSSQSTGDLAVYPIAEAVYSALLISSFTSNSSHKLPATTRQLSSTVEIQPTETNNDIRFTQCFTSYSMRFGI